MVFEEKNGIRMGFIMKYDTNSLMGLGNAIKTNIFSLTVDEQLFPYRGKTKFTQFII